MITDAGNVSQPVTIHRPPPINTLRVLGRLIRAIVVGYTLVSMVLLGLWFAFGQNVVLLP